MATIVTVHGTFARSGTGNAAAPEQPWWKPGSQYANELSTLVEGVGPDGRRMPVSVEAFEWSGDNSEVSRRAAGDALLGKLRMLEQRNESYCVIGHSHGGSVISSALLSSARARKPLQGLKGWITVGTPFIEMKRETLLFERLTLVKKVILVASLMLVIMFGLYLAGQFIENGTEGLKLLSLKSAISALLMSIPAVLITGVLRYQDARQLFFYRRKTVGRARSWYGDRWTSFWHGSDEAVQGLRSLRDANLQLFDTAFAAPRLTMIAIIVLPLVYLAAVSTPPLMVGLANFLRDAVYEVGKEPQRLQAFDRDRKAVRQAAAELRKASANTAPGASNVDWSPVRKLREDLKTKYADYDSLSRALRFQHEFLEENGKPCASNTLCGEGRRFAYNTKLVYHVFTDEAVSALVNDDTRLGIWSALVYAIIPMAIVPLVSIAIALLLTVAIKWLAGWISWLLSKALNRVTMAEIKRSIYGNDTDGEIAIGAGPHPSWLEVTGKQLPPDVADPILRCANTATQVSLAKFRNAISDIVLADGHPKDSSIVSDYLSWKELVHSCYFEQPELRKLVARTIADGDGFEPSVRFADDPDYARTGRWLASVRGEGVSMSRA